MISSCIHNPIVAHSFGKFLIVLYLANTSDIGLFGDSALVVISDYGDEGTLRIGKEP